MAIADGDQGIFLYNANVNSGNGVWLVGAKFTNAWKRLVRADPVEGKSTSSKYTIVETDHVGIENPIYMVQGTLSIEPHSRRCCQRH